jgi:hypothetical protein
MYHHPNTTLSSLFNQPTTTPSPLTNRTIAGIALTRYIDLLRSEPGIAEMLVAMLGDGVDSEGALLCEALTLTISSVPQ